MYGVWQGETVFTGDGNQRMFSSSISQTARMNYSAPDADIIMQVISEPTFRTSRPGRPWTTATVWTNGGNDAQHIVNNVAKGAVYTSTRNAQIGSIFMGVSENRFAGGIWCELMTFENHAPDEFEQAYWFDILKDKWGIF